MFEDPRVEDGIGHIFALEELDDLFAAWMYLGEVGQVEDLVLIEDKDPAVCLNKELQGGSLRHWFL